MARKSKSLANSPKEQLVEQQAVTNPPVETKVTANPIGNKQMSIIEYSEDLSKAEAPVPLPASTYPAQIRSVEVKVSQKGNRYVNVTFVVSPDDYPADYTEGDLDGTLLSFGRLSPDETARARYGMKKFCDAIGAKYSKHVDLNDWIGLSAMVEVTNDEYVGETRANIKRVIEA